MQLTLGHVPQPRKTAWDATKTVIDSPRTRPDATADIPGTSLDKTSRTRPDETTVEVNVSSTSTYDIMGVDAGPALHPLSSLLVVRRALPPTPPIGHFRRQELPLQAVPGAALSPPPTPPIGHFQLQELPLQAVPGAAFSPGSEWLASGVEYWYV